MLTLSNLQADLYRMVGVTSSTARTDIIAAARWAILQGQQAFVQRGNWRFLDQYTDTCYITIGTPYTTGTVTTVIDSKSVAGSSTVWTAAMARQFFQVTNKEFYEIASVTPSTTLTLSIPYQATGDSALEYQIFRKWYDLPLNFVRPLATRARLTQPGYGSEWQMGYDANASYRDLLVTGKPEAFCICGTRGYDYYNTSTVTIATSSGTSTWTLASGTLPTDIVDREVRIVGEDRSYRIATRATAATFTTYAAYVNPSDASGTQSTASSYAITPADTQQLCFDKLATDYRYIFSLPYVKRLPELLASSDVSPISLAGYDEALLACCRYFMAMDGRTSMRADLASSLKAQYQLAMDNAWSAEQYSETLKQQDEQVSSKKRQYAPSWINN